MKKILIYFPIYFLSLQLVYSQANIVNSKILGGANDDYGLGILKNGNGELILVGYSESIDGDVLNNHTIIPYKGDIWVIKMDTLFNIIWQKCIGGVFREYPTSFSIASNNDIFISAWINSSDGDVSCHNVDILDEAAIFQIDDNGNLIDQKCFGLNQCQDAYPIYVNGNLNNILVVAETNDSLVNSYKGASDIRVTKMDSLGNILFDKCYGGEGDEAVPKFLTEEDNSIVIACNSTSLYGDVELNGTLGIHGNSWIYKINENGEIVWKHSFGGLNSINSPQVLEKTRDKGLVLGLFECYDDLGKAELIKLDSFGNIEWDKCIGGINGATLYSIKEVSDSTYIGLFTAYSPELNNHHGGRDAWVVKLNQSGEIIWDKCFGSSYYDRLNDFIIRGNDTYLLLGITSYNDGDNFGLNFHGKYDLWLAEISENTTATENLPTQQSFQLYPNPASYTCSIKSFDHSFQQLQLFDITGRLVREWKESVPVQQKTIDLDGIEGGLYTVRVISETGMYGLKLIVQGNN